MPNPDEDRPGEVHSVLHVIVPQREGAVGGADLHVLDLAVAQRSHGQWQPIVLAPRASNDYVERLEEAGLPTITIGTQRPYTWRRIPKQHSLGLVHAHGYEANYLLAFMRGVSRGWSRLPTVVTAHGWIETTPWLRLKSSLDRMAARTADIRIVCAHAHAPRFEHLCKPTVVIHNGVAEPNSAKLINMRSAKVALRERFTLPSGSFLFGTVGRLSPEKRIDLVLHATRQIVAERPQAHVIVVGGGRQRPELQRLASRLAIEDHVRFAGLLKDLTPIYAALDALVQPSDTEGTPRAVLEAMAHGVPVIATDVGDVSKLLDDGLAGMFTKPNDATALAQTLLRIIDQPSLGRELAERAQAHYKQHFTIEHMRQRVNEAYALAVGSAATRGIR